MENNWFELEVCIGELAAQMLTITNASDALRRNNHRCDYSVYGQWSSGNSSNVLFMKDNAALNIGLSKSEIVAFLK